jgi:1-acyl-sn-glycerol-3-phosphate acyltransferase
VKGRGRRNELDSFASASKLGSISTERLDDLSGISKAADAGPIAATASKRSSRRGFWALFVTQFQNAFSDNVLKFLATFLVIKTVISDEQRDRLVPLVLALFSIPFILFSMAGGYCADRFNKRNVAVTIKLAEIGIMTIALIGLWHNVIALLMVVVFLMSTHSAFFGPTKYGLIPELLEEKELSWGNGLIGLGTFGAIITGTIAAGVLSDAFGSNQFWSGLILIGLAVFGTVMALNIPRGHAANPQKEFRANFLSELWAQLGVIRQDRILVMAIAGSTFIWFLSALFQPTIIFYGKDILNLDDTHSGYLQAALAIGIGLGSFAAGYVSGKKIEYGLIPLGALGLALFGALLSRAHLSFAGVAANLTMLGFSGGFYTVPINALIQHRPDSKNKGGVIATSAFLSWIGIFLASGVYWVLKGVLHLTPPQIFLVGAAMTLLGAAYSIRLMPDSLLRLVLWFLTNSIYRVKVLGRDNIPEKGGALFVCNHLSQVDALLLLASTDRRIRFIMYKGIYEKPLIKPLAKIMRVIPISSELRPREMIQSLREASEAIKNGEVVCIFAEGQITRIGHMLPFRRGFEKIMKDVNAPIIPVALDGVWGSIFSFEKQRFFWKLPRRIPYPVTVNYGAPLPHTATPFEVRQAVQGLMAEAWAQRKARMTPLHRMFVRTARRHPFRFAMADAQNAKVTFGSALARTVFMARRLKRAWAGQKMVGVLLPPSVAGACVNFAAMLMGKVPVNLNYTVSETTLASCVRQCEIKTIVTSKTFLEKLKLKLPCDTIFLEELVGVQSREQKPLTPTLSPSDGEREGIRPAANGGRERAPSASGNSLSPSTLRSHATEDGSDGERVRGRGLANSEAVERPVNAAVASAPTFSEKLLAFAIAWFFPIGLLEHALGREQKVDLNDLATVIFSSGSTGEPKGVMLSHYNVGSNIEQLEQVFGLDRRDCILGILPFFHSFGFTGTLCLPAALGVGVVYHANPLDPKTIGQLVNDYAITFLLATPTFLQLYLRGCSPEQFGSLRVVMTGAEKLPERLASAFEEQFGIRPLEGYGCTECAPVVAVNTHDFRSAGFRQVGAKRGKIGHPVPGVSVRVVDAETMQPMPVGQPGLLLVRGPNVMQGYLGRPDKTAEVLLDDLSPGLQPPSPQPMGRGQGEGGAPSSSKWYVTGDIAAQDEDGFLQITDRLSRFSKIGGEMVPHIKVEEQLHELAGATEQSFVVVGVPDEKKGERLVVLHKLADGPLQACLAKLAQADLPNLWKPRPDQFFRVETFPLLGTGKLDLRKVREVATELSAGANRGIKPEKQT